MSRNAIAKSIRIGIAAMAALLIGPCWGQGVAPSASDAAFKEIVLLESAAATASEERRYSAAIDDHSRALQLAEQLQRPRLVAVLLVRLGQDYEDNNEIQRGLVSNEMAFKALQRDPSLDLRLVIRRVDTASKGFSGRPDPIPADLYRESVARDLETEERDPTLLVRVLVNIGNGYFRQPQEVPALQFYELALQQPEIDKAPLLKGYALANYGELLRRQASPEQEGSLDKAESTLKSALALIEGNGRPEDARRALTSLARLKAQRSQTDEALALYARAIVLYRKADDERGEARAQLGKGYVELGRNGIQSDRIGKGIRRGRHRLEPRIFRRRSALGAGKPVERQRRGDPTIDGRVLRLLHPRRYDQGDGAGPSDARRAGHSRVSKPALLGAVHSGGFRSVIRELPRLVPFHSHCSQPLERLVASRALANGDLELDAGHLQ